MEGHPKNPPTSCPTAPNAELLANRVGLLGRCVELTYSEGTQFVPFQLAEYRMNVDQRASMGVGNRQLL
jgi:hypothetical protein